MAITREQARDRNLPSAPPKATDKRGSYFTDTETWQAEALDPNDLADILRKAIEDRLDRDMYRTILAEETEQRRELLTRFT